MKQFHMKRLRKLADFLDALPDAKFNFAVITHQGEKPMRDALKAGEHRCGTVACAVGWMPALFPRDVCWLNSDGSLATGKAKSEYVTDVAFRERPDTKNFAMASAFFGIEYREAEFLFDPWDHRNALGSNATAKQVAKHIRKFVAMKEAKAKEKAAR